MFYLNLLAYKLNFLCLCFCKQFLLLTGRDCNKILGGAHHYHAYPFLVCSNSPNSPQGVKNALFL